MDLCHWIKKWQSPVIIKNAIFDHWSKDAQNIWNPGNLIEQTQDLKLNFRMGKPETIETIQWEPNSSLIAATLSEFIDWMTNPGNTTTFRHYSPVDYWAYSSYNYVKEWKAIPKLVHQFQWQNFGFSETSCWDSTFWIGSSGAYTPCHYDTYGCNVVAQLYGHKQWILFPPEDTEYLYPSRLPYEESSVFSLVNLESPDLFEHPKFQHAHPHILTLDPGDVLFVPRHWWHYVKCVEGDKDDIYSQIAISANLWIDDPELDTNERLGEALTQMAAFGFSDGLTLEDFFFFNTQFAKNEQDALEKGNWLKSNLEIINSLLSLKQNTSNGQDSDATSHEELMCKSIRLDNVETSKFHIVPHCSVFDVFSLEPITDCSEKAMTSTVSNFSLTDVFRALTDPEVIALVRKKLLKL